MMVFSRDLLERSQRREEAVAHGERARRNRRVEWREAMGPPPPNSCGCHLNMCRVNENDTLYMIVSIDGTHKQEKRAKFM
jgi:hypothetical protein